MIRRMILSFALILTPIIGYGQTLTLEGTQSNERLGRYVRIAVLGVQMACEITKCTDQASHPEWGRAESSGYPAPGSYPTDVQPTYEDGSGQGPVYGFVPNRNRPTPQSRNLVNSQDGPSGTIRSRVQWVVSRIRQVGGTVRGIRFRKVGPWRWECNITFRLRGSSTDSYCRVRADGTVEGI